MKKTKTLLLLMFIQSIFLYGQHEIGLFGGFTIYQGDLVYNSLSTEGSKLGGGVFYKNHFSKKLALKVAANYGQYSGADSNFPDGSPTRDFSFDATYTDFSVGVEYLLLGGTSNFGKFKRFFSPFVHLGLGGIYANPVAVAGGRTSLKEEDLEFGKFHFMIPVSGGLKVTATERLSIDIEFSARTPFSDYLDGISQSANPDKNDWYYLLGFNLGYKLGEVSFN